MTTAHGVVKCVNTPGSRVSNYIRKLAAFLWGGWIYAETLINVAMALVGKAHVMC